MARSGAADVTGGDGRDDSVATVAEETRATVAALASADGEYTIACKDSGISPAPVATASFERYDEAERARDAAARYRAAMRELDPALPEYHLVVSRQPGASVQVASVRERTGGRRANGLPETARSVTVTGDRDDEWLRIENGAVVYLRGPDSPLDDEFVTRQLRAKL